jgi:hypothetical protein
MSRFLSVFFGTFLLGLGALSGFNVVVNPFGAYRTGVWEGLGAYKTYDFRRLYVAELLRQNPCEVVFIGSSRTYIGVDPRWPEWGTAQAWNVGVPSAMMNEIGPIGRYALKHTAARRIYLFADFFAFNDSVASLKDFDRSRFSPKFSPAAYHLRNLITIDSTEQSLEVIRAWRAGKPASGHVNGFRLRTFPTRYDNQRSAIQRSLNYYLKSPSAFPTFKSYRGSMAHLAELARGCRAKGVELTVVVLPVHVLHLEAIRGAGLWEVFEQWERDLAATLADEGKAAGRAPFVLWDFTSYRGAPAEAVPARVGDAPAMAYFRDEAHALPGLVQLVARRVTGQEAVDPADGGELGVLLTPENVEAHLAGIARDREAFARARKADVRWVANLAAQAAEWNAAQALKMPH